MTKENLNHVEEQVKALSGEVTTIKDALSNLKDLLLSGLQKVEGNFFVLKNDTEGIHKKIDTLARRIEVLARHVEALDTTTSTGFDDVGGKIVSLSEEISKIAVVTGYTGQYDNMKGLN